MRDEHDSLVYFYLLERISLKRENFLLLLGFYETKGQTFFSILCSLLHPPRPSSTWQMNSPSLLTRSGESIPNLWNRRQISFVVSFASPWRTWKWEFIFRSIFDTWQTDFERRHVFPTQIRAFCDWITTRWSFAVWNVPDNWLIRFLISAIDLSVNSVH